VPQPPTPKQLRYLRHLALRSGRTFATPKTKAKASQAIRQLERAPRSTRVERDLDRRGPLDGAQRASAIRDDELVGWGASARWAHRAER